MTKVYRFAALICAATVATTTSAFAGGPVETMAEDPVAVGASVLPQDWSGFYGGLTYAKASSTNNYYQFGVFDNGPYDLEGNVPGLMVGYNWQRGALVYGAEVVANIGTVRGVPGGFDAQEFSRFIDVKGRAGYAMGKALVYGTVSYATSSFKEDYATSDTTINGFGYGVGVDYALGSRFFVGLEYLRRDISGTLDYAPSYSLEDTNLNTISLRLGAKF